MAVRAGCTFTAWTEVRLLCICISSVFVFFSVFVFVFLLDFCLLVPGWFWGWEDVLGGKVSWSLGCLGRLSRLCTLPWEHPLLPGFVWLFLFVFVLCLIVDPLTYANSHENMIKTSHKNQMTLTPHYLFSVSVQSRVKETTFALLLAFGGWKTTLAFGGLG